MKKITRALTPVLTLALAGTALAQEAMDTGVKDYERDLRVYTAHVSYLANDFMEGRVPGSKGMEIARDYAEHFMQVAGLEPAFTSKETLANGSVREVPFSSYRQAFPLGGTLEVKSSALSAKVGGQSFNFESERDYTVTGLGGSGDITADAVFVGYSIGEGPNGFTSYPQGTDLTGKIAVMYRFEPMDDERNSKWNENGEGWSNSAGFDGKLRAAFERGAEACVVINTPFANDERINRLDGFRGSGAGGDKPVVMVSAEAGKMLLDATNGHDAKDLWNASNEGNQLVDLGEMTVKADLEREVLNAENVGGIIRGKGKLADEWVVVGAHLDHIGMGYFGSRSGSGKLHPGADDNASGSPDCEPQAR